MAEDAQQINTEPAVAEEPASKLMAPSAGKVTTENEDLLGDEYVETMPNPDGFFSDDNDQSCSVKVAVRIRPFVGRELRMGNNKSIIETHSAYNKLQIGGKSFSFDSVFDMESQQEYVYDTCSKNLVLGTFKGYNATILAYGQTGSGKTHSMGTGSTVGLSAEQIGIVPRVFDFIFEEIENRRRLSAFNQFSVKVQFLELYNEELHDLLDLSSINKQTGENTKQLQIREEKNGSIRIDGLKAEDVTSKQECLTLLNRGIGQRVTSATLMNEGSSRSHAIFTITIEQKLVRIVEAPEGEDAPEVADGAGNAGEPATSEENISAKFHFVDLAGSERIKKTGAVGKQLLEGISINKGLLALGNVISALTDEKKIAAGKAHIPYRDSKLTRILQDSLGGNSRTTMIACVSPAENNYDETVSSIKYASRARNIQNKPVVNRDPNSMLIEKLKGKISSLEVEVKEYQQILKENNIDVPDNLKEQVEQKVAERQPSESQGLQRSQSNAGISFQGGAGASASEVRELKLKLARQAKELKEANMTIQMAKDQKNQGSSDYSELQKERDELILKQEAISEYLQKNNVKAPTDMQQDPKIGGKRTSTLIDEYKAKIQKFQAEVEKKNTELLGKSKKVAELTTQMKRDEALLKKAIEESQKLKRESKKPQVVQNVTQKLVVNVTKEGAKKGNVDVPDAETIKNQFMDKLTNQLENFFTDDGSESDTTSMTTATSGDFPTTPKQEEHHAAEDYENAENTIAEQNKAATLEDKQKLLSAVKQNVDQIKNDLGDLLKNTWASRITEIQGAMQKIEQEKRKHMSQQAENSAQAKAIEKEYKHKMDELGKQLTDQKIQKKKKEDSITKTMAQQESRIKVMETELAKMKQKANELESQKKYGEERFSKFKSTASKDLHQQKKTVQEKDKTVSKLKQDLKKTDQMVQQKISELQGLQKKAKMDKERRESEQIKDNESKGIDIDVIKDWINQNTQQLLKQQELSEFLKKQLTAKEEIEDEMLTEGDRLTDLMVMKERLEYEQEALAEAEEQGDEVDEERQLEVEAELEDVVLESDSITQTLDTLDEHLNFVSQKINKLREEISSFDMDSVQPPRFKGLNSVEMARATLRTFFMVLLDLNVYKRDLETKCIEQDETILELQQNVAVLQERVVDGMSDTQKAVQIRKAQAIKQLVGSMGEDVVDFDNRDMNKLGELSNTDKNQLTKMSLSKIVSNLRTKLKEEEKRTQSLNLKLDSIMKEKEQLKLKFLELQKQKKATSYGMSAPAGKISGAATGKAPIKSRINTGLSLDDSAIAHKPSVTQQKLPQAAQRRASFQVESPKFVHGRRMSFKERRDLKKTTDADVNHAADDIAQAAVDSLTGNKKEKISTTSWKTSPPVSLQDRRNSKQKDLSQSEKLRQELRKLSEEVSSINSGNAAGSGKKKVSNTLPKAQPDPSLLYADSQPETVLEVDELEELEEEGKFKDDDDLLGGDMDDMDDLDSKLNQAEAVLLTVEEVGTDTDSDDTNEDEAADNSHSWKLQDVCDLPLPNKQRVVNANSHDSRLFVLYTDLTVVEVSLVTKQVVRQQNLAELMDDDAESDKRGVAFAIFQDLNMIAVATPSAVFLFDYSSEDEFALVTVLSVKNVAYITFIEVYIILVIDHEDADDATLACYQIDDDEPMSQISIKKFLGQRVLIRGGEESVFFATGTQIGAISVPDMELQYQEDSGHTEQIIDFAISKTCIYTTSLDLSLRVFDVEQGMLLIAPMEEMECDSLSVQGYHLVARCGNGQAMFVFKYEDGFEELEEVDFIECGGDDDEDEEEEKQYLPMKGGLKVSIDGHEYNMCLVGHIEKQKIHVRMLKNKTYL